MLINSSKCLPGPPTKSPCFGPSILLELFLRLWVRKWSADQHNVDQQVSWDYNGAVVAVKTKILMGMLLR